MCIINSFSKKAEKVFTQDNSLQVRQCMPITYIVSSNKPKPGKKYHQA